MTERLGYGRPHYDDDDQQRQEHQVEDVPWYILADPDYSPEEEGDAQEGLGDFPGRPEQVEYQEDFVEDDSAETEFQAQFGWRSKARRRKKGRRHLPDMRGYVAPVFVRVADLEAGTTPGSGDAKGPKPMTS